MKSWALISGGNIAVIVTQATRPTIDGDWQEVNPANAAPGDDWQGGNAVRKRRFEISQQGFWDRFSFAERVDIDLAMQHDPAAANPAKKKAAKYRVRMQDILKQPVLRLKSNLVDGFVRDLEADAILAVGRADTVLLTPAGDAE